jgi:hypothetical protein
LPGRVNYGEPAQLLVPAWGNPEVTCHIGHSGGCFWFSGTDTDTVALLTVLGAKPSLPETIKSVSASSFGRKTTAKGNLDAASRSRLKGWRTSKGVHIGMAWAEAKKKYPERLHCSYTNPVNPEGCLFRTAPYRLTIDGHARRQVFNEFFRRIPTQPLVNEVGAILIGDEGRCEISVSMSAQLAFKAVCWGPLKAARFHFTGEGRMLSASPEAELNRPYSAIEDDGDDLVVGDQFKPVPTVALPTRSMESGLADEKTFVWKTICDHYPGTPSRCFPDRPTVGTAGIWPAGVFEEWQLGFTAHQVRPSLSPAGTRSPMPQFTFTAEFVGMPDYTITSAEQGESR